MDEGDDLTNATVTAEEPKGVITVSEKLAEIVINAMTREGLIP